MNGVHDMGGMHGMGPIEREINEPVFHRAWEGRVFALRRAMSAWGKWNIDAIRHAIERLPPAEYLRASYYERQLNAFVEMLVGSGLITRLEAETATPAPGSSPANAPLKADDVAAMVANGARTSRNVTAAARFERG